MKDKMKKIEEILFAKLSNPNTFIMEKTNNNPITKPVIKEALAFVLINEAALYSL
jgi:hypothetical protein